MVTVWASATSSRLRRYTGRRATVASGIRRGLRPAWGDGTTPAGTPLPPIPPFPVFPVFPPIPFPFPPVAPFVPLAPLPLGVGPGSCIDESLRDFVRGFTRG